MHHLEWKQGHAYRQGLAGPALLYIVKPSHRLLHDRTDHTGFFERLAGRGLAGREIRFGPTLGHDPTSRITRGDKKDFELAPAQPPRQCGNLVVQRLQRGTHDTWPRALFSRAK